MAILSKIRERSMFLIVVIGMALFAFVASPKDILDFFNSDKVNSVGEINGETISRKDFANSLEIYKSNSRNNISETQAVNTVWKRVLSEKIYKKQLEEAGVVVGEKDVWDAIIEMPNIKNAALFQNEIGLFDEEKLKEYLVNLKENSQEQGNSAWLNWLDTEKNVKAQLEKNTYTQLVELGIGASLEEGERNYYENQTKLSGSYVYVPYTTINDSLVEVSSSEIDAYIKSHASEFSVEASRDMSYVKFDIAASKEDEKELKDELSLLVDTFETTEDVDEFILENESDLPIDSKYLFKKDLPSSVVNQIFSAKKGRVVGPYRSEKYFKLSKVVDFVKIPDSVKASHILISYAGSRSADASVTRTEVQAKKMADSILRVLKKKKSKFSDFAKDFSADKSNAAKGGDLDWFGYGQMVPEFRDYAFTNKRGAIGIVETIFGFHIVKIDAQKNIQKVVQLADYAKMISASEATENEVFEKAETLAYELSKGKKLADLVKEGNYTSTPLIGIKEMEDRIPGIGKNRAIVRWAFNNETNVNDAKRFDLDKGYAVVLLTSKTKKGLSSASKVLTKVKPILVKEKKANLIADKVEATDLANIAKRANTTVKTFSNITIGASVISGLGLEPAVVGTMYASETNKVVSNIAGQKGVFSFVVSKKEAPAPLSNYEESRRNLIKDYQNKITRQLYDALEDLSIINDKRSTMY